MVEVVIDGRNLKGQAKNGRIITSVMPEGTDVVGVLDANDVRIIASPEESGMPGFLSILLSWFPMLLFMASGFSSCGKCRVVRVVLWVWQIASETSDRTSGKGYI